MQCRRKRYRVTGAGHGDGDRINQWAIVMLAQSGQRRARPSRARHLREGTSERRRFQISLARRQERSRKLGN